MYTQCLYMKLKNTSGGELKMRPYLPAGTYNFPAGDEKLIPFGDFGGRDHRGAIRSKVLAALEADLESGAVEIMHTASPIWQDAGTDLPRRLQLEGAVVSTIGACWNADSDSENEPA